MALDDLLAHPHSPYASAQPVRGGFVLVQHDTAAPLLVSSSDWPGVTRAAGDLGEDMARVTQHPVLLKGGAGLHGRKIVLMGVVV